MIVSLVALFPNHLNLNGDLANIKVLTERLAWRGVTAVVTLVDKGDPLPTEADFILLGHGSEAAWLDLAVDLERLKPSLLRAFDAGVAALAVASGYERLFSLDGQASIGLISSSVKRASRVSRFMVANLDGAEALGYVNSDAELEPILRIENVVGTLLHGPILAKNDWLAELIISEIFKRRSDSIPKVQAKEKADQVAGLIQKVWELEEPLARE